MAQSIMAGETTDLQYDPADKTFKPKADTLEGPVFTIQSMDYWQWQDFIGTTDAVEKIRKGCELGLTAIDGDAAKATAFLARPAMLLVNPLFQAIVDAAAGN